MSHTVQFYETEEALHSLASDFIAEGLIAGERVIVVATEAHRREFAAKLRAKRIDYEAGRLLMVDAEQMLSSFMSGEMPDAGRFNEHVGGAIRNHNSDGSTIRIYGEMVDVLWRDGNTDAALRLEDFWNDIEKEIPFSLLCAYSLSRFFGECETVGFESICRRHDQVVPSLRQALAAQQRSEAELKDFVDNAPIGLHWIGPDGKILWANDAELAFLGYTRAEYVGHHINEFHADQDVLDDILRRLKRNEEIHDYETRVVTKDGSVKHVAITSNALFVNGEFIHTRCFTRDITDRKRLQDGNAFLLDATTALNRTLDYETRLREIPRLVIPRLADRCSVDVEDEHAMLDVADHTMVVPMKSGDRILGSITFTGIDRKPYDAVDVALATEFAQRAAIALENARLYQLAQVANRTKDEFLATLSHELRTPLTAILGWSRMMLLGGFDAETTRTALETIERSAHTQAALIDDLLDLSKIVTGKLTLQTDLVDLTTVVYNAVQTTKLAADAKNITLDVAGISERAIVIGDATRLQQIVWNLLSNAIKFSENGGRVSLSLDRVQGDVRIVVRDAGRGINPEFLPHVFEPFRQADGASTRMYNGLGLGLAIVKYLAEHHGGNVAAESAGPGLGATFTVTLPLAARRSKQVHAAPKDEIVDLQGISVLLVDDDEATRDVVSAMLRRCGADVQSASCVNDACTLLDAKLPQIVVTDIAMPDLDGFALLRYLRGRNGSAHDVRMVALTAMGQPHAEKSLRDAGFHAYVRKPVDPLEFARVISTLQQTPITAI
jgi:PAS domain S-box-containing protein